ncbi:MAG: 2-phosphosulfolactate phosphatase [Bacteroidia bacterium]|nr:MAG: 2-phosphosulfolactate phosphatase [Bacteroidia bacterium]
MYNEVGKYPVSVCLSPLSWPLFSKEDVVVIVTDIFRASTAICAGFENGVSAIIPVETIAESEQWKAKGYISAGERDGKTLDCADFGNSPFNFMAPELKGQVIVMNTTNGTKAIKMAAEESNSVLIGAFTNLSAVCNHAISQHKEIIILCAGWKDRFSMEDSLFAGAAVEHIIREGAGDYHTVCDSAIACAELWNNARHDLPAFIEKAAHRHRLRRLGLDDIIPYSLQNNITKVVPILRGDRLTTNYNK